MNQGWIMQHRSELDWPVFQNVNAYHLWQYLKMKASHKAHRICVGSAIVTLERGQLIYGRTKMPEKTGLTVSEARTAMKTLRAEGCVELAIHPTKQFSIVTVVNYDFYQSSKSEDRQPFSQPIASLSPAFSQPLTTNNNENNAYNVENENEKQQAPAIQLPAVPVAHSTLPLEPQKPEAEIEIPASLKTPDFLSAWNNEWMPYRRQERKSIKPICLNAQLVKLEPHGPAVAIEMIRQSISQGWTGLFPPKSNTTQTKGPVSVDYSNGF